MNSINQNQPEDNLKDLSGHEGVQKVRELVEINNTCFFSTQNDNSPSAGTRPMTVQEVDDNGNLWFLISNDSFTYQELQANPKVKLYFQGSAHSDFLYIEGNASMSRDKEKIEQFWSPIIKTWFTEGKDDPRITVVKIQAAHGYYWDNKHGNAIAAIKIAAGALLGKTLDDSIEGKITL